MNAENQKKRILLLLIFIVLCTEGFSQVHNTAFPDVLPDTVYNRFFVRNSGWNGGDGAYSVLLPDDRILWTFGDTFFGPVDSGRVRNGDKNVMVRNSAMIQESEEIHSFKSLNQGFQKETKTLIPYKDFNEQEHWYWPLDATVCNNKLQMVLMHMKKIGEGMWGFASESVDLAVFSLPELKPENLIYNVTNGEKSFGSAIWEDDDGFTYLYGSSGNGMETRLHVARAPKGDLTQKWQFWNGEEWLPESSDFAIHKNVSSMFSIWKEGNKYYLLTQETFLGRKIFLFESDSPLGPFTNQKLLYEVPEEHGAGSMFSYNAIVHPELSKSGELVVSYSKNPNNFWDNFTQPGSADKYLPVFIRIKNWKE
jgi:hypothetical protein